MLWFPLLPTAALASPLTRPRARSNLHQRALRCDRQALACFHMQATIQRTYTLTIFTSTLTPAQVQYIGGCKDGQCNQTALAVFSCLPGWAFAWTPATARITDMTQQKRCLSGAWRGEVADCVVGLDACSRLISPARCPYSAMNPCCSLCPVSRSHWGAHILLLREAM